MIRFRDANLHGILQRVNVNSLRVCSLLLQRTVGCRKSDYWLLQLDYGFKNMQAENFFEKLGISMG